MWELVLRGEERGGDRTDGGSELEGSAQTSPQQGEEGRTEASGSWALMLEGALARVQIWGAVHLAAVSVPGTFMHPLALCA